MDRIPFLDLQRQYQELRQDIDAAIASTINSSSYIQGEKVRAFEAEFSKWNGSEYCIGCANGTDAIEIALEALGIGPGDEVIVPAMTWISTAEAVVRVGASPRFVDIDNISYCIDVDQVEKTISRKTKAIIAVHLYGNTADVIKLRQVSDAAGIFLVEDCAQAHGALVTSDVKVGNIGHVGTFSFFPGKNLGAYGDAGCIVTKDEAFAKICREIGNHGQIKKHNHCRIGRNSRLDGLQAAILSAKLPMLNKWIAHRQKIADYYSSNINPELVQLPEAGTPGSHAFHLYVVLHKSRDLLLSELAKFGVETAIHYPAPLTDLKVFAEYIEDADRNTFPCAKKLAQQALSLPISDQLSLAQAGFICKCVNTLI